MRVRPLLAAAVAVALVGCTRDAATDDPTASAGIPPALSVAAVDFPSAWLAEQVGGDGVEVTRISADQVAGTEADLFVYIPGLDSRVDSAASALPEQQVVDVSEDISRLASPLDREIRDPYVWFDPVNVATMAQTIGTAMAKASPTRFEAFQFYGLRAFAVQNEALQVDQRLQEQLNPCRVPSLVVAQPVFTYLARAYAFDQVPLPSWRPAREPVPALYYTPDARSPVRKAADAHQAQAIAVNPLVRSAPKDDLLQGLLDLGAEIAAHQDCPLVTPSSSDRPG